MRARILNCRRCGLRPTCRAPVPPRGPYPSPIAIVGEAPGDFEDRKGQPFIGPAGKLLADTLAPFFPLDSCFITNVVACRPPDNDLASRQWAIAACRPNLTFALAKANPDVILALGATALNVFNPGAKITKVHGRPLSYRFAGRDRIVYPTFHPAAALRNPTWHGELVWDIFRLWALLTNEPDVWSYVGRPELHRDVAIGF